MILLEKVAQAILWNFLLTLTTFVPLAVAVVGRIETERNQEIKNKKRVDNSAPRPRRRSGGKVSAPSRPPPTVNNVVPRVQIPYWKKRGWKKINGDLKGYYRTRYGAWQGKVKNFKRKDMKLYIFDPPPELDNHSHGQCFMPRKGDKFFVHFNGDPGDVGVAIQKVEQILKESFER